jgi:hypothetical protein
VTAVTAFSSRFLREGEIEERGGEEMKRKNNKEKAVTRRHPPSP